MFQPYEVQHVEKCHTQADITTGIQLRWLRPTARADYLLPVVNRDHISEPAGWLVTETLVGAHKHVEIAVISKIIPIIQHYPNVLCPPKLERQLYYCLYFQMAAYKP